MANGTVCRTPGAPCKHPRIGWAAHPTVLTCSICGKRWAEVVCKWCGRAIEATDDFLVALTDKPRLVPEYEHAECAEAELTETQDLPTLP